MTDSCDRNAARARWHYSGRDRPPFARAPGPGQRSVWDFPRPPTIEVVPEEVSVAVSVAVGSATLARTRSALRVLETGGPPAYYVPPDDVDRDRLAPAGIRSFCEWKGEAAYWRIATGDDVAEPIAWSYPDPFPEFERLRGWLAFYPGRVACFVGSLRVAPQPGNFYGGWVTPDLVGPFKGEPGTEGL